MNKKTLILFFLFYEGFHVESPVLLKISFIFEFILSNKVEDTLDILPGTAKPGTSLLPATAMRRKTTTAGRPRTSATGRLITGMVRIFFIKKIAFSYVQH